MVVAVLDEGWKYFVSHIRVNDSVSNLEAERRHDNQCNTKNHKEKDVVPWACPFALYPSLCLPFF